VPSADREMVGDRRVGGRRALLRDRSFRWLAASSSISILGSQFTQVALPWLVLKVTGDSLMLGLVLAAVNVPRALLILLGGALTDRYSAKRVLILTKYVNLALTGGLGALVLSGHAMLWEVFALAFAIGIAGAFGIPSASALLPEVVESEELEAANALLMALRQVALLAGPLLAGLLIAAFRAAGDDPSTEMRGLGIAFLIDASSFGTTAWMLAKVDLRIRRPVAEVQQHVLRSIVTGLVYLWRDYSLRTLCLYFAATTCLVGGPLQVALPVLADTQLSEGAAALGSLMAAQGAGVLVGMTIAALRPRWRLGTLGLMILLIDGASGVLIVPLGHVSALWQGLILLLPLGALGGMLQVAVFTWMQRRVPAAMMGRAMSLFMFIFLGMAPVSASITGWVMRGLSAAEIFAYGGALLVAIVLLAIANPRIRAIGAPLASVQPTRG
jgi:Na+/melibiose symporter-like transporter